MQIHMSIVLRLYYVILTLFLSFQMGLTVFPRILHDADGNLLLLHFYCIIILYKLKQHF